VYRRLKWAVAFGAVFNDSVGIHMGFCTAAAAKAVQIGRHWQLNID
jgi:hypothetical protein